MPQDDVPPIHGRGVSVIAFPTLLETLPASCVDPSLQAFALIEASLGRPLGEVFSSISERPVAAASLGQVRIGCRCSIANRLCHGLQAVPAVQGVSERPAAAACLAGQADES